MIIYYFFAVCLCLFGIRPVSNEDPLDRRQTLAINGFCVLLVFVRHIYNMLNYDFSGERWYLFVRTWSWQLIVIPFLFYSGYGVMRQFMSKGDDYVRVMPRNRILTTWVNFVSAIMLYAVAHLLFGDVISLRKFLAACMCWVKIGNPSWYIFCILWCYAFFYGVAWIVGRFGLRRVCIPVCHLILTVWYILAIRAVGKPDFWYNTVLAFPFGLFVALYKESVMRCLRRWYWMLLVGGTVAFFAGLVVSLLKCSLVLNLVGLVLMLLLLLVTMRIRIENSCLVWLGKHLFPIYIYHNLFFYVFRNLFRGQLSMPMAHVVVLSCLVATLLAASQYHYWEFKQCKVVK